MSRKVLSRKSIVVKRKSSSGSPTSSSGSPTSSSDRAKERPRSSIIKADGDIGLPYPAGTPDSHSESSHSETLTARSHSETLTLIQAIRDSNDDTIVSLFINLYGDKHRYVLDDGYWLLWLGTRWAGDTGKQALYNDLAELRNELDSTRSQYNNSMIENIIRKLSNQRSLTAVVKSLEVHRDITILAAELDNKPHLVCFINGVYSTVTGQFFDREELIKPMFLTKRMNVWHKPSAKCPKWHEFLSMIFQGDMELMRFVQKAASLSLCGNVREERLFFAYGSGANGKTTFFEVLNEIYHSYHQEIDPSILIKSRYADQRMLLENIANLKGVRFATSNEIPDKSTYNDMAIKQLCSRDTLTAKKIYQSVMSFQPSHTLWIRSNHKPLFNVHDQGMLRRLALIPFAYRIPDSDRIERYEDILLKERSGILNWLIDGWEMYQKQGLSPFPEAVSTALSEYTNECDTLKQFIEEYYIEVPGAVTLMKDFTAKYNDWAKENHYPLSNSRSLASDLRKEGRIVVPGIGNVIQIKQLGLRD